MRILIFISKLSLFSCMISCQSLLYHPSRAEFVSPDEITPKPSDIWFEFLPDQRLHAWHFEPPAHEAKKRVIIQFHGNAENLSSHFRSLHWLVEKGYDLVIFDYRSYGKSDGDPTPENTVEDGKLIIQEVIRKFPQHQLIIFGQSLGGLIALESLVRLAQENIRPASLVVIEGAFDSYRKVAQRVLSRSIITWPFQWLGHLVMSDRFAPRGKLKWISPQPLLFLYGEKDFIVDNQFSKEMFESASDPKDIWEIPEGGHIDTFFYSEDARKQFLKRLSFHLD